MLRFVELIDLVKPLKEQGQPDRKIVLAIDKAIKNDVAQEVRKHCYSKLGSARPIKV